MRALTTALGMFTLLPVPPTLELDDTLRRRTMLAFPWAGLVCGLVSAAAATLVVVCRGGGGLAAMAGLAALAGVTGAMHLDGVADTADGLASRKGPEEALALMKRSDIGPMGVATVVLVLLLQAAALASPALSGAVSSPATPGGADPATTSGWPLVAALVCLPMVGRVPVVLATRRGTPGARTGGFGALFTGITPPAAALADAGGVVAVCWAAGLLALGDPLLALGFPGAALVAWLGAARWQRHLVRRLGGLTGDTFGSLIEVAQTTFVLVLALGLGAASR